jgi:predicted membrane-bound spermidine synthase
MNGAFFGPETDPIEAHLYYKQARSGSQTGRKRDGNEPEPEFVYKKGGTISKTRAKGPLFNDFCVPLLAWDTSGTERDKRDKAREAITLSLNLKHPDRSFEGVHLHWYTGTSVKNGKRSITLGTAVFLCGAIVMVYEIIGSRLLSPYIGSSIYIWTSLIGVILGSLSLGYWLGGRSADRKCDFRVLASVIFAAAGLISAATLIKDIFLSMLAASPMILELKALIAALVLFAPASVFLGMVTPYAVRLKVSSLESTGRTVGNLYALSTIGSIVGTFAAGFILVPFVGSVRTLYLIAAALFVIAFVLWPMRFSQLNIAAIALFVLGICVSEYTRIYEYEASELIDIDTEYSRVQVFRSFDPLTQRPIRAYATDPFFAQSAMYFDSDELVFPYAKYFDLLEHFNPQFQKSLLIGSGAYSYPKHYLQNFPDAQIDVVEIDPRVREIAKRYFRLRDDPRMQTIDKDGRDYLNNAKSGGYDAVLLDAFGSLFSVPYQLTTREAVEQISRVLNDRGVVIANIGSSITGDAGRFGRAEIATYRTVFPQVLVFKVRSDKKDSDLQNLILIGSKSVEPDSLSSTDPRLDELLAHLHREPIEINEAVLTDDLAPVEYYNSIAQRIYLAERQ